MTPINTEGPRDALTSALAAITRRPGLALGLAWAALTAAFYGLSQIPGSRLEWWPLLVTGLVIGYVWRWLELHGSVGSHDRRHGYTTSGTIKDDGNAHD